MLRYKAPTKLYNNFLNYCILCQNLQESHDNNKIIFVTIIKDPLKNSPDTIIHRVFLLTWNLFF